MIPCVPCSKGWTVDEGETPRLRCCRVVPGRILFRSPEPTAPLDRCTDPPADALAEVSRFALDLEPNPISPGGEATLIVGFDDAGADPVGGAGALWQCWTGAEWESTHQILRPFASPDAEARYIEPSTEPTIPGVGLPVPNSFEVVVPDVAPGVYRIAGEIWADGERLVGLVVVE